MVQPILKSIGDVDDVDDLGLQTGIEHVSFVEIVLEVSTTCQHNTRYNTFVVTNEGLHCNLTNFTQIVMPLLLPQTGETH